MYDIVPSDNSTGSPVEHEGHELSSQRPAICRASSIPQATTLASMTRRPSMLKFQVDVPWGLGIVPKPPFCSKIIEPASVLLGSAPSSRHRSPQAFVSGTW